MHWFSTLFRRDQSLEERHTPAPDPTAHRQTGASRPDNPIHDGSEDSLGRVASSEIFCTSVLRLNATEGLVVGVLGPWGSGKTSFVNLTRHAFERETVYVVDFNPWMFSGTEQLVQSFFSELSAQLKLKPGLAKVGETIEHYGELFANLSWLPLLGPWVEGGQGLAKILSGILQRKKAGVSGERSRVNEALKKLDRPVIVVLDDIDRLSTNEIRDIFRLVRLTANFPNLIYLLAFDRHRVEAALSEEGFPGRAYLEKILQISFDLPAIPELVLNQQIFGALDATLAEFDDRGSFDEGRWPDVFMEVIKPLITNMRDVRRYAAAVGGTVRDLRGQMELVDVLALEAIRIFLPDVFHRLPALAKLLTSTADYEYRDRQQDAESKRQLDELIAVADKHQSVVRSLIERLFLAAQRHLGNTHYGSEWTRRWLRERRVANIEILRLYLERIAGQGLIAFNTAEQAWALMPDRFVFDEFLRSIPSSQVVDVISSLETYEDAVSRDRILPGIVTLLNIVPTLPETDRGMFSFGSNMVVGRVVYRLLKSENSAEVIEAIACEALPHLQTQHAKLTLIEMIGHTENVGHKMIPEESSKQLAKAWRAELRALPAESLAAEPDLLRSVLVASRGGDDDEPKLAIPPDPRVTLALLSSARSESRSQTMGSRAVKRSPRLAWKILIEIYGSEETLSDRIQEVKALQITNVGDVLDLADRYRSGWRPKDFGDE